ncbi:hypothetical protein GUITHDRAFT_103012 [Guillardia theta CCMP2712]|uniref:Methyltransferase domain-containing protein n=1 Tax=Guillardia theta (strain CCMP2712) TaxID=905079 RepID=L1JRL1_GUITC|nr:hypothetical protein GUITHDRAFT_103012 [Guillardia theta CCMP2712]EKX51092.1 hypothetical protein GUITHDRAFT_103012 [Guillardia theta CCMP2712]|eukprot:XP_005838072.1 hypothetical protein GUITHDRAFT_103012 [Guillardia theta CCMP2712]
MSETVAAGGGGDEGEKIEGGKEEGVDEEDELFATAPRRPRRLFGYDWAGGYVSPFRQTSEEVADKIMQMAGVAAGSVVVDLGSGDGILLVAAAKRGARAVGVELSRDLNAAAMQRAADAGVGSMVEVDVLKVIEKKKSSTSSRQLVAMYLLPEILQKLKPKFLQWLQEGIDVVTVRWRVADFEVVNDGEVDGFWMYAR